MIVKVTTTKTDITQDGQLTPTSAIFELRNTGGNSMIINDSLRIYAGNTFSLNLQALVGIMESKGFKVINTTQYNIRFVGPLLWQGVAGATLIETFSK